MNNISIKNWIEAARPKTLFVSIAPVIMSVAFASKYIEIKWLPAIICLVFALMAQITSNFINDYSDGVKGSDKNRLGPERMVASGKITAKKMLNGTIFMIILSFVFGCTLLYWGGLILLPFGIVILLCALAYSAGPFPLSRHALGDLAVILFYGIAPTVLTFFIQTGFINCKIIAAGIAIGIVADNLLIVNNYRDAENDSENGKKTTVTLLGKKFMKLVYFCNPLIAIMLGYISLNNIVNPIIWSIAVMPFLVYSIILDIKFSKAKGLSFNKLIGLSSFEAVFFALTVVMVLILS